MIAGTVTNEDVPVIQLAVAGQAWSAVIDTGFNGDLELPASLRTMLNARYLYRTRSLLGAGQIVDEDTYCVDFPLDGQTLVAEATFVSGSEILMGTHLLRQYRLDINFPARTVLLERVP
jgi:predicted aspartyl protease